MLLSELLTNLPHGFCDVEVRRVTDDSRLVERGDLFIALKGEHNDGKRYIEDAIASGAAAVVCEGDVQYSNAVTVDNAASSASHIYSNYYGRPADSFSLVAVTGTNGKTSTVGAARHILSRAGLRVGTIGTAELCVPGKKINKEDFYSHGVATMTTPTVGELYRAFALMRDSGCDAVICEASSHALAARRFDGASVDVGVFTNLSPEHLDRHHDMESYFAAKSAIADISNVTAINLDDSYGQRLFYKCKWPIGFTAQDNEAAILSAKNVLVGRGIEYDLTADGKLFHISSPMIGRHAVYNTLAALSIALSLGVPLSDAARYLSDYRGVEGRMEIVSQRDGEPTVIVDYAHTPRAFEVAISAARAICRKELIVVFGCGGERDRTKRAPMGRAATALADHAIITEDNPRGEDPEQIIKDILCGVTGQNYETVPDRAAALRRAVDIANGGDVVLCLGKGHEKYIIDKCGKHPFDEKEIIKSALDEKYGDRGK